MSRKREKQVFCPLTEEMVGSSSYCAECVFSDGRRCCYGQDMKITGPATRRWRSVQGVMARLRRLPRRSGKGLRLSSAYERWPVTTGEGDGEISMEGSTDYGVPEVSVPDFPLPRKKKKKEVLPELREEYWDIEPDVPDFGAGMPKEAVPAPPPEAGLPDAETDPGPFIPFTDPGPDDGLPDVPPAMPPGPPEPPFP